MARTRWLGLRVVVLQELKMQVIAQGQPPAALSRQNNFNDVNDFSFSIFQ